MNASNELKCIVSMFLTSFNVCFVFGYAYFMCLKTAIWLFLGQDLAFFGEDRLATLLVIKVTWSSVTCSLQTSMSVAVISRFLCLLFAMSFTMSMVTIAMHFLGVFIVR